MQTKTQNGKICSFCQRKKRTSEFSPTKTLIYPDGLAPICNECIMTEFEKSDKESWVLADYFCRVLDLPFIPKRWAEIELEHGSASFGYYARLMQDSKYDGLDWSTYNEAYRVLQKRGLLERELPLIEDEERKRLHVKWGISYSDYQLLRLESLFQELMRTHTTSGGISEDSAKKVCVLSMLIDERLAEGGDGVDKLISSYDKMTKIGDFTTTNTNSAGDLSSMGEITAWLERRGWINKWYTGENKDIVDEIINSMKTFTQRLYTHESGLSDDIDDKVQQLRLLQAQEEQTMKEDIARTPDTFFLGDSVSEAIADFDKEEVKPYAELT